MKKLVGILLVSLFIAGCGSAKAAKIPLPTGTPPPIPHQVTAGMACSFCHAAGTNRAPATEHINLPNCLSCHKPLR
ncbi:MAG: hypothetical protein M0Z55_02140 [Peptococcaceae bacterium]|nr:hypothetical protein [Peptococcaceae bacterium]